MVISKLIWATRNEFAVVEKMNEVKRRFARGLASQEELDAVAAEAREACLHVIDALREEAARANQAAA